MLHSPPPSKESSAPARVEVTAAGNPPDSKAAKGSRFPKGRLPILHNGVFWAATPALVLFALTVVSSTSPLPGPIGRMASVGSSVISADNWVVPASQTLVVSRQAAGQYAMLRGRLRATSGDAIPSPGSGQVARMLVSPGQSVRAGQQIALLTVGIAPAEERVTAPSPVEHLQTQAESAQIAAAQQQEKLEARIRAANEEFDRAKQRVAAAQERVVSARRLIERLQKGEEIAANEAPAPTPTPQSASNRDNSAAKAAALRESQKLQAEAEAAEAKARAAAKAVRDAEAQASAQQQKLDSALAAAKAAAKTAEKPAAAEEEQADNKTDGKTESSAKSSAQTRSSGESAAAAKAVSAARENAAEASAHVADLRRDATRLQARAAEARSKANAAARRATQNLQLFDGESSAPAKLAPSRTVKAPSEKMSISQAVRIARAAMDESEKAIKDAERIRRQVEKYGRPVESTRRRFDEATRQLQAAQQRMWDNAPTMRTTQKAVFADRSGIITWVANPSRVVHAGDPVANVGRPDRLEVVVQDKTNAWKALKPNARVLALVQRKGDVAEGGNSGSANSGGTNNGSTPDGKPAASVTSATASPVATSASILSPALTEDSAVTVPTVARVLAIAPPAGGKGVARIRIAVHNPPEQIGNNRNGLSPRAFAAGMPVFFSLAQPTKKTAIRIPTAAVRREPNGKTFVAVLSPIENQQQDRLADQCRVQWREVFLAPGDGVSNQVKMGLKEGERVALRPDALYNFTLSYGAQATVSVEQI